MLHSTRLLPPLSYLLPTLNLPLTTLPLTNPLGMGALLALLAAAPASRPDVHLCNLEAPPLHALPSLHSLVSQSLPHS